MTSSRPRRAGTWFVVLAAIVASLAFVGWRLLGPGDGGVIPFYADAWQTEGVQVAPPATRPGGLAAGDVVIAVADRPLAGWLDAALDPTIDRSAIDGPEVRYTVRRGGAATTVPITLSSQDVGPAFAENWSVLLFVVVLQLVAVYVLWRRPEVSAASALALTSVGVTGSTLPWLLGLQVSDITRGWPFALYALTAGGLYMVLWPAGALHLPLAMQAGPAGPGRRVMGLAYAIPLGGYAIGLLAARLVAPSSVAWMGSWAIVQGLVIVPTVVLGIGLSIRGYRAATAAVRRSIRWAAIGGGVATIASLALLYVPQLVLGTTILPWSAVGLIALPLPLGIAAGILRHQLFDIDVVVNRTLVYGGATVSIVAIYAVSLAVLGSLLPLQGGFPATLLATGVAAVVALPIRDVLQGAVNRLMYGDRDDPYRALTRLGQRLEATLDPVEAPNVIVRTVAESLRVPWVALRVGPAGEGERTISHGPAPVGAVTEVPLIHGSEIVGDLLVSARSGSEPLSVADRRLLDALATRAGAAVHALGLQLDLIASRERLVAAREEERRRIRRDLHDGLGPTLAAIGMRAEVAANLVASDSVAAERVLGELRREAGAALTDIRRLVDALRPPALDELGLVGAIEAQAGRLGPPPSVAVVARGPLPELPAAVEVAAYRIAVEAMTNAARHAAARSCVVRLDVATDARAGTAVPEPVLVVEVSDDGRGMPEQIRPGIGLLSMRERAAEVGGSCVIEPVAEGGTRVLARLPLNDGTPSRGDGGVGAGAR